MFLFSKHCLGISPWVADSPPRHMGSPRLALFSGCYPGRPGLHPRANVGPGDAPPLQWREVGFYRNRERERGRERERESKREREWLTNWLIHWWTDWFTVSIDWTSSYLILFSLYHTIYYWLPIIPCQIYVFHCSHYLFGCRSQLTACTPLLASLPLFRLDVIFRPQWSISACCVRVYQNGGTGRTTIQLYMPWHTRVI